MKHVKPLNVQLNGSPVLWSPQTVNTAPSFGRMRVFVIGVPLLVELIAVRPN